jgi:hypothetical protein
VTKLYTDANGFLTTQRPKLEKTALAVLIRSIKPVEFFTDDELMKVLAGDVFVFDTECYPNFWCCAFKHLKTGKYALFERSPGADFNSNKLSWMLWTFCLVGFNSKNYDIPMIAYAISGASCAELKEASDYIIKSGKQYGTKKVTAFDFENKYKVNIPNCNHIDLFNVCPVNGGLTDNPASLKTYAARLHADRLQDLPIPEDAILSEDDAKIIKPYCCNDLDNTELLFNALAPEINLRMEMSKEYNVDLRSKSDAQVAEAVINSELQKVLGFWPKVPTVSPDTLLQYNVPEFIFFQTPLLQDILQRIANARFQLDGLGSPIMPKELESLQVQIGSSLYSIGMGGLHSNEKSIAHIATDEIIIADNDVESFYPRIILNQRLFPSHLGEAFLTVYNLIVDRRISAKHKVAELKKIKDRIGAAAFKVITDTLKIVINGSFGKLGNKYSTLYAPQLMLQVTFTGQLVLLMLIEMLELNGISVVSGNTDGIVSKYHKSRHDDVRRIITLWELHTNFKTEETRYLATYSRDVNNYIAVKENGDSEAKFLDEQLGCKTKGVYSERGSALNSVLSKNPEALICSDAVLQLIKNKVSIEKTVRECKDIRRFVCVRNVKGGAQKEGVFLGKVVRWYYAKDQAGTINYVLSGNKVPNSDGAKPLMDLPEEFPTDIDYDWYIKEAVKILYEIGYLRKASTASLF